MARSVTPATVRALLAIRDGRRLVGGERIAAGHVSKGELPLVQVLPSAYPKAEAHRALTLAGELVLAAYKLGRSRWGAHG